MSHAIFHALQSLGVDDDSTQHNETTNPSASAINDEHIMLGKCIVVVGSIYLLYVVSWLTRLLQCGHGHNHNGESASNDTKSKKNINQIQRLDDLARDAVNPRDRDQYLDSFCTKEEEEILPELTLPVISQTRKKELENVKKKFRMPHIVYVIILSSILHNLTDGLAIGVAFSDSISGGLSTTIAVLCHEIPHVIGHFAIIYLAGLTVHMSLSVVMVLYISTFIGAYVGVTMGTQFKATDWIFAATSGMFLYVALVQLLPEMLRDINEVKAWSIFILQNIGFLIGVGIMILIAIYEDSISIRLSHLTK